MKYLLHLLYVAFGITLLTACEQQLTLPPGYSTPRTVVYSELVAGGKAEVRIGKSKPVVPGVDNQFEKVTNATVQLSDKNGQILETLQYTPDDNSTMCMYQGKIKLDAARTYKIEAFVPGMKEVSATAAIPPPFRVDLKDSIHTVLNGRPVLRFHFNIYPLPGVRQYLAMEALKQTAVMDTFFVYQGVRYNVKDKRELYEAVKDNPGIKVTRDTTFLDEYLRIPCYTQDENADNNQVGGLNESYNCILFTQLGKPLSTYFYINANALTSGNTETFTLPGRVLVCVKSVSKEYYDFLLTYEKVKRNPGLNSLVQAIQLRGNTAGGFGIVGGCNRKVYYLYYDRL
ncbi:DUF4249 domain-containing protein [Chitinophaga nivalis]|uniref:DUF4249 domain-containing protein n=1 Tax=Chitinophaga nivalis TaxID=2991709 RepID=A0ABT3ILK5_9BACT|nr:DUF4249 domain-containing protein [Chitinophaga nivalis]MCW3465518.1 DUF4249 domain-containing protein [Chitinophaga nivalis]MCW3484791.1 DUF4249 domain-containing protein [Chitinophaga nivalis]